VIFLAQPSPGDLKRRPETPGPDLQLENSPIELEPGYAPSTVRPLARGPRVLVGWPLPLGFGLDGRLLLARRGRVYV